MASLNLSPVNYAGAMETGAVVPPPVRVNMTLVPLLHTGFTVRTVRRKVKLTLFSAWALIGMRSVAARMHDYLRGVATVRNYPYPSSQLSYNSVVVKF